jgi:nicotinamidase/pyrazinamidase
VTVAQPDAALILVDLQNDFLPGGALPVPDGDAVVPMANQLQTCFDLVIATQDWHPTNHVSFAANHPGKKVGDVIDVDGQPQMLWPVHCVQNTQGADFPPALNRDHIAHVIQKGTDPRIDSYSGFFDNGHKRGTGLGNFLHDRDVVKVFLAGLATDYCVKFTALDARRLGFEVVLLADACRGIDLAGDGVRTAIEEMKAAGVAVTTDPIGNLFDIPAQS